MFPHSDGILSVKKSLATIPTQDLSPYFSLSINLYVLGLIYFTISTAFIPSFNLLSELGAIPPVYGISPILSIPPSLIVNTFLVPISKIVSPLVSGFLKNIWSIVPGSCVCNTTFFKETNACI